MNKIIKSIKVLLKDICYPSFVDRDAVNEAFSEFLSEEKIITIGMKQYKIVKRGVE